MLKSYSLRLSAAALFFSLPLGSQAAAPWHFDTGDRVVAMSDIHGAHDGFTKLLRGLELLDGESKWSGGAAHLVIVGDILDRGADSRAALALVMRLEGEALKAGGAVHMLLGNHEIMNMVGDLRYVADAEYAAYQDVEDSGDRERALASFLQRRVGGELDEAALLEKFKALHPPGFFGHQALFRSDGLLGSWLLDRPVLIRVNDSLFTHGGLSPAMQGRSVEAINSQHREAIGEFMRSREYFIDKGVLEASTNFYDQPVVMKQGLEAIAADNKISKRDVATAKALVAAYNSEIFADDAPTWYRGNVGCSPAIEAERLSALLVHFDAHRLVVGHTPTATRGIESRFNKQLIRVDTGMLKSRYRGQPAAAVIEGGTVSSYYAQSEERAASTPQARRVGPRPGGLSDAGLEELLATAVITGTESLDDGLTRVVMDYSGQPLEGLFSSGGRKGRNIPAVAAYRLDRHLALEMVPVTMPRTVEAENGALGLDYEGLMDEEQRTLRGLGGSAWCPLKDQFNLMYLVDILLHNKGRAPTAMRYTQGEMKLLLIHNRDMLGKERKAPKYLGSAPLTLTASLRMSLEAMDESMLESMLGDVLDDKRRKAILSRRDYILRTAK